MQTKVCFKCGIEQPIVSFYKHPQMGDGRLNKCKSCTRYDVRTNYKAKVEQYREYDRERYRTDPVKRTPARRDDLKRRAGYLMHNAVNRGKLQKLACEVCGDQKSEGHHEDYAKPLEVTWLCRKHHKDVHRMHADV